MANVGEEKAIMDYVCRVHGVTPDEVTIKKTDFRNYDITIKPKVPLQSITMDIQIGGGENG